MAQAEIDSRGERHRNFAIVHFRQVEEALTGFEHLVSSDAVLEVIEASPLSVYDSEFVALAEELSVQLVTEDKAVRKAFPEATLSMKAFLA